MGSIKPEVKLGHLAQFSREADLLKPFLSHFDVVWAARRRAYNTELSVYFLKPSASVSELFGFDREIVLFISDFPTAEPRTMQAVRQVLSDSPASGRVDQTLFFLISNDQSIEQWVAEYAAAEPQSRLIVSFSRDTVANAIRDPWLVRNAISRQLYSRDLFDDQLPLQTDSYFFGRESIVADLKHSIRQSRNWGVFGLRKTGKTSTLFKLKRIIENEGSALLLYYDCKFPSIRSLRWNELLRNIIDTVRSEYSLRLRQLSFTERLVSSTFEDCMRQVPKGINIAIVLDEIEYVSPLADLDPHWHDDFIPFWQTIWSVQSATQNLSTIIAGVNPRVAEIDVVGRVQNPLFGIITPHYLKGLTLDDLSRMLRAIGRRMGLKFSPEAIVSLHSQYGGHPMLTRRACTHIHRHFQEAKATRPCDVTEQFVQETKDERDRSILFYCGHIVSELQQFYPDEYEMLEMLATGRKFDYYEIASADDSYVEHIRQYGLVAPGNEVPEIRIPVVGRYLARECRKRHGIKDWGAYPDIESMDREEWLRSRKERIAHEMRRLGFLARSRGLLDIYGVNGFAEAEKFDRIALCNDSNEFQNCVVALCRCFVEPIQNAGRRGSGSDVNWNKSVKDKYPRLWHALNRIRIYRHDASHLELNEGAARERAAFLQEDLGGSDPSNIVHGFARLQIIVIDELLLGILCEIDRIE